MIKDFKQFLKIYRVYKKGKNEMDKIKDFISNHYKELLIAGGFVLIYKVGYKVGVKETQKTIYKIFDAAGKALEVHKI